MIRRLGVLVFLVSFLVATSAFASWSPLGVRVGVPGEDARPLPAGVTYFSRTLAGGGAETSVSPITGYDLPYVKFQEGMLSATETVDVQGVFTPGVSAPITPVGNWRFEAVLRMVSALTIDDSLEGTYLWSMESGNGTYDNQRIVIGTMLTEPYMTHYDAVSAGSGVVMGYADSTSTIRPGEGDNRMVHRYAVVHARGGVLSTGPTVYWWAYTISFGFRQGGAGFGGFVQRSAVVTSTVPVVLGFGENHQGYGGNFPWPMRCSVRPTSDVGGWGYVTDKETLAPGSLSVTQDTDWETWAGYQDGLETTQPMTPPDGSHDESFTVDATVGPDPYVPNTGDPFDGGLPNLLDPSGWVGGAVRWIGGILGSMFGGLASLLYPFTGVSGWGG